jgi:hypothetical protein
VRSWIFRNRLRLRAIYGPRPSLRPAAGIRPAGDLREGRPEPVRVPAVLERHGRHTIVRTRA